MVDLVWLCAFELCMLWLVRLRSPSSDKKPVSDFSGGSASVPSLLKKRTFGLSDHDVTMEPENSVK